MTIDLDTLVGAPPDLFVSDWLDAPPDAQLNYVRDARAIQAMAMHMADEPETALPHFVQLSIELTGAASAGLSLLEPQPAPGVFRWHFLQGELARFDGATTPRNFSPCGVTLDRNEAVLTRHPERVYSWISNAGIVCPEVLLVPLYAAADEPFGTLWVVSRSVGFFTRDHAVLLHDLARCISPVVSSWRPSQRPC